jgi:AraC family transcriptional regulator
VDAKQNAIRSSLDFIENKLPEPFGVDELAGQAFFSKSYFQRLFAEIMGEPVMEYVNKRRMQRAGAALRETDESVLELALSLGYQSHEGFTRAFKAYYGVPPLRYRKANKYFMEGKIMLSSELKGSIKQHMDTIAERMAAAQTEMEAITASASAAVDTTPNGGSMLVLIGEWITFAAKAGAIAVIARDFLKGEPTVFELTDKVSGMMKQLDDTAFILHLLRFLAIIEAKRMGEREEKLFYDVIKRFDNFHNTVAGNRDDAIAVLNDLLEMIRGEIKNDAAAKLKEINVLLDTVIGEGNALYVRLQKTAEALSPNGGPTGWLGSEVAAQAELIKNSRRVFGQLSPVTQNEVTDMASHIQEASKSDEEVHIALRNIGDAAFHINIAAFNLTIETARAGKLAPADMSACADAVRQYAGSLHRANSGCAALYGEYKRLTALLHRKPKPERDPLKFLDDCVFQCRLICNQLILEAERARNGLFKAKAESVLTECKRLLEGGTETLPTFSDTVKTAAEYIKREAEARDPHGKPFAYIACELEAFAESAFIVIAASQ